MEQEEEFALNFTKKIDQIQSNSLKSRLFEVKIKTKISNFLLFEICSEN